MVHKQKKYAGKSREKVYLCQSCEKSINITDIPDRGRPRKYCKNCSIKMQKEKNMLARKERNKIEKTRKSLELVLRNPELREKLEQMISIIEKKEEEKYLKYKETMGRVVKVYEQENVWSALSEISDVPDSYLFDYDSGKYYDDTPKKWSENKIVELVLKLLEKQSENKQRLKRNKNPIIDIPEELIN